MKHIKGADSQWKDINKKILGISINGKFKYLSQRWTGSLHCQKRQNFMCFLWKHTLIVDWALTNVSCFSRSLCHLYIFLEKRNWWIETGASKWEKGKWRILQAIKGKAFLILYTKFKGPAKSFGYWGLKFLSGIQASDESWGKAHYSCTFYEESGNSNNGKNAAFWGTLSKRWK